MTKGRKMEADANQVNVAAVQMCPQLNMTSKNLANCLERLDEAVRNGANLIAFPEATLSGYVFESKEEVLLIAETVLGPSVEKVCQRCASLGVHAVIGLIEKEDGKIYNTAVLIGPEGIITKYRKTHLPFCGADRFVEKGDIPYKVFDTQVGKLGIQICYDVMHPEGFRSLALNGAEIIINIVNYPQGVEFMSEYILPARVSENRVHLVTCDRVGTERGVRFLGHSRIIGADSEVLVKATGEEIIYAQLDLNKAREKRLIIEPGEIENDVFEDRRPELYGDICKPKSFFL